MSDTKHTPGPWHSATPPNLIKGPNDETIAAIANPGDIRLIEDAPNLLAALESAQEILEDWDHHTVKCDEFDYCQNCRVRRELARIESAIAKAKG